MRGQADGLKAALAVDELEPGEAEQADRGRPAAEPLGVGRAAPARDWPATELEGATDDPGDRPPRVEGAEDVAEDDAEQDEAEPDGDEDERDREVAVRRFGARSGPTRSTSPEEEDARAARRHLGDRVEQRGREPARRRAPAVVLELAGLPGDREREERNDQDERRRPREQPLRDRQVLAAEERVADDPQRV